MQADDLLHQLRIRGGFEAVNNTGSATQLRLMGRVKKELMAGWLILIQQLLRRSSQAPWSVDISKQYFLRNDQVVFGWRLIFQGDLATNMADVVQTIVNAPRPRAILEEQPLPGVRGDRNQPGASGKGAQGVLKAAVGPMAVAQAQFMAGRPS